MALIKSALVSAISGKIGGMVGARNRYGAYLRNWVKPVNPNTSRQQDVRALMGQANIAWAALTDQVRSDWNTYAAAVPWQNRIGDTIYLTGKTMYVRTYVARLMAGLEMVAAAPSTLTLPSAPEVVLTATASTHVVSATWTATQYWTGVGGALSLYCSKVVAPTVLFIPQGSLLGSVLGAETPPASPQTQSNLDLTNQAGNRVRVSARALLPDGRVSSIYSSIVEIG